MHKLFILPRRLVYDRATLERLAMAWLVSAACLLLGALLALVVGQAHYARGLALLALVLAGWMHVVEIGLAQALVPSRPDQPMPPTSRWLSCWYCGFFFAQGLGLAAGYLAWVAFRHG